MQLISYDGVTFASLGVTPHVAVGAGLPGEDRTTNFQPRRGASPLLIGATDSGRPIPVLFTFNGSSDVAVQQARLRTLLAALDVHSDDARTLVAQIGLDDNSDGVLDGTATVSAEAVIGPWMWLEATRGVGIEITFYATDALWTETTESTETEFTFTVSDATRTFTNNGATTVAPEIRVHNRTISPAVARDRRRITVTNNADLPLDREVIVQPISYTVGMTGGSSLLKDGTFHPVTRHYPGATGDVMWFAFPVSVDPGESETYDLIGQTNTEGDLDTYTRFDGNYCAQDIAFESHNVTSATSTTVTVSGASWPVNRWAGAGLRVISGTGSVQTRLILSNTATVITLTRGFTVTPDATSRILLIGSGYYQDGGTVSSSTIETITDASQSWVPGSLVGLTMISSASLERTITANTATQITFTPALPGSPTVGTAYRVYGPNYHRYYVDQVKHSEAHRGGWQINKRFTQPSKVLWGDDILSGWEPFLLTENSDDYNQIRWTEHLLGGSDNDYFPILNATRRRGQDRRLPEEGQADGVSIQNPLGYQAIRFDYQIANPNAASGATKGIAKFILAGREPGGDEFETYVSDDTLRATMTTVAAQNVDLSAYGNPTQLYMGLQPRTGSEISRDALETDEANVRWYTTLRMWLNIRDRLSISTAAVESVTPVEDEFRIGDYALQVGQRDGQRLYVKATDELVFDCANARAYVDDGAGNLTDVTYAVTPVVYDSNGTTRIAEHWPVLEPGNNTFTITTDTWTLGGVVDVTLTWREQIFG